MNSMTQPYSKPNERPNFHFNNLLIIFSFFKNLNRITSEKYIPNTTDVLRSRVRTIGVVETQFKVDDLLIRMFDVGGQRSERRKWIQCFDDVRALLFVVAISEYDMTLIEEPNKNRLRESFQLFSSVCNNTYFKSTATVSKASKLSFANILTNAHINQE